MLLKNLTKRERYIALAAISMGAIAIIYNFIIEPVASRWSRLNNEINAKSAMLNKDSRILSMYESLAADYEKYSSYVKSTKSEEEEVADILAFIENISRNNSCFIANIKPIGAKNLGSYKEILVDVTAEADMNNFSKFLYDIENQKNMILKLRRFTITAKSTQKGVLSGTFIISKVVLPK